jgi:hypothetical protein
VTDRLPDWAQAIADDAQTSPFFRRGATAGTEEGVLSPPSSDIARESNVFITDLEEIFPSCILLMIAHFSF